MKIVIPAFAKTKKIQDRFITFKDKQVEIFYLGYDCEKIFSAYIHFKTGEKLRIGYDRRRHLSLDIYLMNISKNCVLYEIVIGHGDLFLEFRDVHDLILEGNEQLCHGA